jgi:hypothetical protein
MDVVASVDAIRTTSTAEAGGVGAAGASVPGVAAVVSCACLVDATVLWVERERRR